MCVLSVFIAIIPTYLLCQMYANPPEFEFQGTIFKFRKRNKKNTKYEKNTKLGIFTSSWCKNGKEVVLLMKTIVF